MTLQGSQSENSEILEILEGSGSMPPPLQKFLKPKFKKWCTLALNVLHFNHYFSVNLHWFLGTTFRVQILKIFKQKYFHCLLKSTICPIGASPDTYRKVTAGLKLGRTIKLCDKWKETERTKWEKKNILGRTLFNKENWRKIVNYFVISGETKKKKKKINDYSNSTSLINIYTSIINSSFTVIHNENTQIIINVVTVRTCTD